MEDYDPYGQAGLYDNYNIRNQYYCSKGHLTPNADFSTDAERSLTMITTNIAPQWQKFNSMNWAELERALRTYAQRNQRNLYVFTGVGWFQSSSNLNTRHTMQHCTLGILRPCIFYIATYVHTCSCSALHCFSPALHATISHVDNKCSSIPTFVTCDVISCVGSLLWAQLKQTLMTIIFAGLVCPLIWSPKIYRWSIVLLAGLTMLGWSTEEGSNKTALWPSRMGLGWGLTTLSCKTIL